MLRVLLISRTGLPRRHVTFMWSAWTLGVTLDIGLAFAQASWQMCVFALFSFRLSRAGLLTWGTVMYALVPGEMLGRVSSVDCFVSTGLIPLPYALTGPAADWLGARATLAISGVLGVLTCGFLFIPGVRDPERRPLPGTRAQLGSAA